MDIRLNQTIKNVFKITGLITTVSLASCSGSDTAAVVDAIFSSFSVGGSVTGLQGSVTLRNNNADEITLSRSGSFSFNSRLATGASYNVTVRVQPAGQACSVSNGSGTVASADITDVEVACVKANSLSGSYQAAPLIQVDSDINDASAQANIDNNDFPVAQLISNFSTVHGFATKDGTGGVAQGDRFASIADEFDVYRVNLQKNQTLRLQVVDFAGIDTFQGDLDLALFDSAFNLLLISDTVDEFENITVPDDGDFYIVVAAFSGTSKYTLNLNGVSPANVSYLASKKQKSMNFRAGESVIKFKANAKVSAFKAGNQQMSLSHAGTKRATLATFDLNLATFGSSRTVLNSGKSSAGLIESLKQKNIVSYQKIKTLQEIN